MALANPQLAVQRAVADGFRNVFRADGVLAGEISNGPSHAEDAVVSPGGQAKVVHGGFEQSLRFVVEFAEFAQLSTIHAAIEMMIVVKPLALPLSGL